MSLPPAPPISATGFDLQRSEPWDVFRAGAGNLCLILGEAMATAQLQRWPGDAGGCCMPWRYGGVLEHLRDAQYPEDAGGRCMPWRYGRVLEHPRDAQYPEDAGILGALGMQRDA